MFARPAPSRKPNQAEIILARAPWLPSVLVVGMGGATYSLASLIALHYFLEYFEDGALVDPQAKTSLFGITVIGIVLLFLGPIAKQLFSSTEGGRTDMVGLVVILLVMALITLAVPCSADVAAFIAAHGAISFAAYYSMFSFSQFPSIKLMVLFVWWCSYIALWIIGASAPISLPMFIVIWAAIGFSGGLLIFSMAKTKVENDRRNSFSFRKELDDTQTRAQGFAQTRRRAARTSGTVSRYGRIPQDTVDLLTNHIRRITGPIAAALPVGTSVERRNQTVFILLETVVSDWRENDNFDLMTPDDIDDFQSFIEAAAFLSADEENAITSAIYKVTLTALARDWLANWNATDNSGPPDRLY